MQSHPVPQNIMQVEFQLVGILTLRQFAYLAVAGIFGWLIYLTPLFLFIRIPIVLAVVGFGLALAFLPVNDMKLEKWIIAFFKAIYAPTKRVWFKDVKTIDFLGDRLESMIGRPAVLHTPSKSNKAKLDLYLQNRHKETHNALDELEDRKIKSLDFQEQTPVAETPPPNLSPEAVKLQIPKTEEPRIIEESKPTGSKIASKVIFTPVATINLPGRNVFVKPVSNIKTHSLNPKTAGNGTVILPIRGETIFQVSDELRQKLAKYVTKEVNTDTAGLAEETRAHIPSPLGRFVPIIEEKPRPALPPINIYMGPVPTPPAPVQAAPVAIKETAQPLPAPVPVKETPIPEKIEAKPESAPVTVTPATPIVVPTAPVASTPAPIIINVTAPAPTPTPPPSPTNQEDNAQETHKLEENIVKLTAQEDMLKGELEKYKDQEVLLRSQISNQKEPSSPTRMDTSAQSELEAKLKKMETEKQEAEARAQKLESLISQLSNQKSTPTDREIITPQEASPANPSSRRTVAPIRAEGKMAPQMTTVPNVINGVVKDAVGLLLPETIIVVKDKEDEPVRALKTNKIGQFAISTALPSGTYLMEVEKEGYEFDIVEIQLAGAILPPIEIRARGAGG